MAGMAEHKKASHCFWPGSLGLATAEKPEQRDRSACQIKEENDAPQWLRFKMGSCFR